MAESHEREEDVVRRNKRYSRLQFSPSGITLEKKQPKETPSASQPTSLAVFRSAPWSNEELVALMEFVDNRELCDSEMYIDTFPAILDTMR
jgi:hypothetical protein